jgi:serine O-acetyltransferase
MALMPNRPRVGEYEARDVEPSNGASGQPRLWQIVVEDYVAHGRRATDPGFHALVVHRLGVARMKIAPRILRLPFSAAYRALSRAVASVYGIELPYSAQIGRRVVFEHQHGIVIHGASTIGDECIIRHGVTLGMRSMDKAGEAPVLGRGVNVGAGAKILGDVRVGDGATIGANAVVLDDVPSGALAVGVPARIVHPPEEDAPDRRTSDYRRRVTDIGTKRVAR